MEDNVSSESNGSHEIRFELPLKLRSFELLLKRLFELDERNSTIRVYSIG